VRGARGRELLRADRDGAPGDRDLQRADGDDEALDLRSAHRHALRIEALLRDVERDRVAGIEHAVREDAPAEDRRLGHASTIIRLDGVPVSGN